MKTLFPKKNKQSSTSLKYTVALVGFQGISMPNLRKVLKIVVQMETLRAKSTR